MGVEGLESLARRQNGLVSAAQARGAGLSRTAFARFRRRLKFVEVLPRVYAMKEVDVVGEVALRAVTLWIPGAVFSHRTALFLWGLVEEPPVQVEVTIEAARAPKRRGVRVHRSRHCRPSERQQIRGLPVTSVLRTLVDAASVMPADELAHVLEAALRKGLATRSLLRRYFGATFRGWRGVKGLRQLWREHLARGVVLDSALEVLTWRALKAAGLPRPECQVPFQDEEGQPGCIDFVFQKQRVAIECLGREFHGTAPAFERDARRNGRLAALGYRIVFVTWRMLKEQPSVVAARVRRALVWRRRADVVLTAFAKGERERRRLERRREQAMRSRCSG